MIAELLKRLKEPSTWAGVSALLVSFGYSEPSVQAVTQAVAALASLAAIFMAEGGS